MKRAREVLLRTLRRLKANEPTLDGFGSKWTNGMVKYYEDRLLALIISQLDIEWISPEVEKKCRQAIEELSVPTEEDLY